MMENTITIFGITVTIDRVAFTIPGVNWEIYWYGIIITVGFVLAVVYGMKRCKVFGINPDRMLDVILVTAPAAILCARLYYVLFEGMPITDFFDIHNGGLAILGGVIGAAVVGAVMCKVRKVNILSALDIAALGFLIGQGIGRWGNFVNQEAYGTYTGSDWFGMTGGRISQEMGDGLVHPCFLYESVWCLLGFLILHLISKKRKWNGEIATLYLIWYGFGRFFIEGLRTDSLYIGSSNIRVSQLLSALMVIAGIVLLLMGLVRYRNKKIDATYVPLFDEEQEQIRSAEQLAELEQQRKEQQKDGVPPEAAQPAVQQEDTTTESVHLEAQQDADLKTQLPAEPSCDEAVAEESSFSRQQQEHQKQKQAGQPQDQPERQKGKEEQTNGDNH